MSFETRVNTGLRVFLAFIALIASLGTLYFLREYLPWGWIFLATAAGYGLVSSALILLEAVMRKKRERLNQ
jgi:hypothetical protein